MKSIIFILLAFVNLSYCLANEKPGLLDSPSSKDVKILSRILEDAKAAWNNGNFFWKEPKPYYFLNAKNLLDIKDTTFEEFEEISLNGKSKKGYFDQWINPENHLRFLQAIDVGLELYEIALLMEYTKSGYEEINSYFYSSKEDQLISSKIRVMNSSMIKLPPIENTTLYRCDHWNPKKEKALVVANYVKELFRKENERTIYIHKSFMSTTRGKYKASQEKFIDNCPYLRIINTKNDGNGRDFIPFSSSPWESEEEVLFLPFTKLKIMKFEEVKSPEGKEQKILYMNEI